jgi:hypothetical protein
MDAVDYRKVPKDVPANIAAKISSFVQDHAQK